MATLPGMAERTVTINWTVEDVLGDRLARRLGDRAAGAHGGHPQGPRLPHGRRRGAAAGGGRRRADAAGRLLRASSPPTTASAAIGLLGALRRRPASGRTAPDGAYYVMTDIGGADRRRRRDLRPAADRETRASRPCPGRRSTRGRSLAGRRSASRFRSARRRWTRPLCGSRASAAACPPDRRETDRWTWSSHSWWWERGSSSRSSSARIPLPAILAALVLDGDRPERVRGPPSAET